MGILDAPGLTASQAAANRYRFTPDKLGRWRKALARVRSGAGNAKLLCVGDSTTLGYGGTHNATAPVLDGYPTALSSLLNKYLVTAADGLGIPGISGTPETRWTPTGNWARDPHGFTMNSCYKASTPFGGSLVYADSRINADTFDVYYLISGSAGTLTVTATGGTPSVVNCVGTPGWGKVTVTAASAATSNTVTCTAASNPCYIVGVEPYLSTTKQVIVGNSGVVGSTAADWALNSTDYGSIPGIKLYAPDLTIIDLGINDGTASVAVNTFMTSLQSVITAAAISGDVVLKTMLPTGSAVNSGANATNEPLYVAAINALTSYPVADYFTYSQGSNALYALGMQNADRIHGNDAAYQDVAAFVFSALTRV